MKMSAQKRALDKIYKRRDRYEIPDWQREKVWSDSKKQKLIDSILRGWKLPKFYFLKISDNPEIFEVLDGQQRLNAIWEFMDGDLELTKESAQRFKAANYNHLPDSISDAFDDYEIEYDEITGASEEQQKEFFQRLQEGLPLTSSERLNSVHSKLRDYASKLAKHKFFKDSTAVSDKRYAFFDVTSKVIAIEIEGLNAGLRYEDLKEIFRQNVEFSTNSASAKRVKRSLDFLASIFPEKYEHFRNRTLVQSVVTLICHLFTVGLSEKNSGEIKLFLQQFLFEFFREIELGQKASDADYIEFQRTVNANTRAGASIRQNILLKKLLKSKPSFFSVLSQSAGLSNQLVEGVERSAENIVSLISELNGVYAAKYGCDLFKATNKTMHGLATIGSPLESIEDYKNFIEKLYFVFKEGPGGRLGEVCPLSFKDVNELRTLNEHDVDHGKLNKVKIKRQKLSAAFKKYSGGATPETLEPDCFILLQVNLLSVLEKDLRILLKLYKDAGGS